MSTTRTDEIRARVEAYKEALHGRVPFEKVLKARYDIEHHAYSDLEYLLSENAQKDAEIARLQAEIVHCSECTLFDTAYCPCASYQCRTGKSFYMTSGKMQYCSCGERRECNG